MADIYGTPNDDVLNGTSGDDSIYGDAGNDTLLGGSGNDQLNGGVGNDVMQDFGGSDTYIFGVGSGQDSVWDWGGLGEIDTVQVTSGITPSDLLITQDWATNNGDLPPINQVGSGVRIPADERRGYGTETVHG
jgi:Ca2+-binding RTX toxin-like protein